ncbi:helix-turn-helix transcriptional regulator [Novosphingobium ovatum]|nr:AlpA family phage regulatory protein [Novosphingobium ovatum]
MNNTGNARLLRITDVMERTTLSRSYIYAKVRRGEFPAPISLGSKCSRWHVADVDAWIRERQS